MLAACVASTIFSRVSKLILFQQVQGDLRYSIRFDAGHAAVVDGAFALEAGAAFDWFAHDAGEGTGGAGGDIVRCAEDRYRRHAQGGGDMHGSGIVGEIDAAGGGHIDKFGERCLAREISRGSGAGAGNGITQLAFRLRSEDGDVCAEVVGDAAGGCGEAVGKPLFRGSIGGSGADADDGFAEAQGLESSEAGDARGGCAVEADHFIIRQSVKNSGAVQEFEIVKTLMPRNFSTLRNRDGFREKRTAAVARVADAFGNAREERDGRGFEGVLKKNGAVEIFGAQGAGGLPFSGQSFRRVGDHAMAEGFAAIEIGYPRLGENGDFREGEFFVQGAQGGEGHYGVADPVGGAHQNLAIGHSFTSVVSGRRLKPSLQAKARATTLP